VRMIDKPLLVVGGSAVWERYDPGQVQATTFISTKGQVYSLGLDGIFKYKGWSLEGDYVARWYDLAGDGMGSFFSQGFNVQGGFFIIPQHHIELTGRLSAIYATDSPPDHGRGLEVGPGINWYFSGNHNGKVQLDVAWIDISDSLPGQTEKLRLGPASGFETTAAGFSEGEQGVLTRFQVQITF